MRVNGNVPICADLAPLGAEGGKQTDRYPDIETVVLPFISSNLIGSNIYKFNSAIEYSRAQQFRIQHTKLNLEFLHVGVFFTYGGLTFTNSFESVV